MYYTSPGDLLFNNTCYDQPNPPAACCCTWLRQTFRTAWPMQPSFHADFGGKAMGKTWGPPYPLVNVSIENGFPSENGDFP